MGTSREIVPSREGRETDFSMASAFGQTNHNRPEKCLFVIRDPMADGITGSAQCRN